MCCWATTNRLGIAKSTSQNALLKESRPPHDIISVKILWVPLISDSRRLLLLHALHIFSTRVCSTRLCKEQKKTTPYNILGSERYCVILCAWRRSRITLFRYYCCLPMYDARHTLVHGYLVPPENLQNSCPQPIRNR